MAYMPVDTAAAWLNLAGDAYEYDTLAVCVLAAEDAVASHCGRRFDVATAGTKVFRPECPTVLDLAGNPLTSVTTLKTDTNNDGTYDLTWSAGDYQLEPFNGAGDDGTTGWPYSTVRAIGTRTFPVSDVGRATVEITGVFGWAAVPERVKLATLITTAWLWTNRASPAGVLVTEFGPVIGRKKANVEGLLGPYRRYAVAVG